MRIWSIHPKYLDSKGLVALWRETLLAQAVLDGKTKGYKNHPQLSRFKACRQPLTMIGSYLQVICEEATKRGYNFDSTKIVRKSVHKTRISVSSAQLEYEFLHLKRKLKVRDPDQYLLISTLTRPHVHPLFRRVPGPIEPWEIIR